MINSPEKYTPHSNSKETLSPNIDQQSEKIREALEAAATNDRKENRNDLIEKATKQATNEAQPVASKEMDGAENFADSPPPLHRRITKSEKQIAYKNTLAEIQKEMSLGEKTVSKIIHSPVVEKTSEVTGKTIFRPNAILGGGICAFIFSGATYLLTRHFGYTLSGFEAIGALGVGFILGLLYDVLKGLLSRRNS